LGIARQVRPLDRPPQRWSPRSVRPYASVESAFSSEFIPPVTNIPYAELTVGVVRETYPHERRVALTPQNAALLLKKGFKRVLVERGAGAEAQFPDQAYAKVGATLTDNKNVWAESDILLKVRSPRADGAISELDLLKEGGVLISMSIKDENVVAKLGLRHNTSFAMDMIPRISRAQVFDALRYI